MSTGPLYPSLLAMTLLPTLLILVAMFFNRVPRGPESKLGTGAVLLLVIAGGVGLTHPSALLSAMIVVLPMLFGWALDARLTTTPVESMRYRWITLGGDHGGHGRVLGAGPPGTRGDVGLPPPSSGWARPDPGGCCCARTIRRCPGPWWC